MARVPERTSGVPEVWSLVSAELDGDGMTIDLRRADGRTLTLTFLITSHEVIDVLRTIQEVTTTEIERLGKLGVVISPIEPHNPDEEYREPES